MQLSFLHVALILLGGIVAIILLTSRYRIHPFFALLVASFIVGSGVGLPLPVVIDAVKDGFGNIMKSLALIIVLGTTLGVILEHSGSTKVMAAFILRMVGAKRASWAMSITGLVVGLPIFCDSGYIVLSGVNNSLARRTGIAMPVMAGALATGLYSVHCLLPPHPGAAAAASIFGVDFGKLIVWGLIVAVPAMIVGHFWVNFMGKRIPSTLIEQESMDERQPSTPTILHAFLPVFVPIVLIAIRSFLVTTPNLSEKWVKPLLVLGDPVIALTAGVFLALAAKRRWKKNELSLHLQDAAEKAGGILVIIGAGGAFGAVLTLTDIGRHFSESMPLGAMGILFPFLLTSILKTAQGSSTVAIITASSILLPLLPALGLDTEEGKLYSVLSMGAGSMMVSHANDAYFWVIAKFSGLDTRTMLKVYTVSSVWMGLVALLMIFLISRFS